jgi:hypothetical protein
MTIQKYLLKFSVLLLIPAVLLGHAIGQVSPDAKNLAYPENRPALIIRNQKLYFNGQELVFGETLDSWKTVMRGNPRCLKDGINFCVWDDLGLEVGTEDEKKRIVTSFTMYLNFLPADGIGGKFGPSFEPTSAEIHDWLPHRSFSGFFELNGFNIDSNTQFHDVMSHKQNRHLHCGTRDCSNPSGEFGHDAKIYITLDRSKADGKIREFTIIKKQ